MVMLDWTYLEPWFAPILEKLFKLSENVVISNLRTEEQKITEEHQISEDKIIRITYLKLF